MTDENGQFGDSEPEDAWHPDDPTIEQLRNILRRVGLLKISLVGIATQREQLRLEHIDEDLTFVIERLRNDGVGSPGG